MISRRRMVMATGALAGTAALWGRPSVGAPDLQSRRIDLANLHTGERLEIKYFRDGAYLTEALAAIDTLLRDFRSGEKHAMDPKLMDYLVDVAAQVGAPPAYSVISGYRSPATNERLHERSSGVSQHSLHMQGRAIDVRMTGVGCADLAARAQDLKRGGVGYYRESNFVHLDTGAFRTWRG
ncbi:MAG TPA: DUF882 domain-containing protein [Steroidobacteraceae bacterium]|nr:DUF882 domain-containing protein [Steroidobacteraceae bacterium]